MFKLNKHKDPGPYTGDIPVKIGDEFIKTDYEFMAWRDSWGVDAGVCKYTRGTRIFKRCIDKRTDRCKTCRYFYPNIGREEDKRGKKSDKSYYHSIAPVG